MIIEINKLVVQIVHYFYMKGQNGIITRCLVSQLSFPSGEKNDCSHNLNLEKCDVSLLVQIMLSAYIHGVWNARSKSLCRWMNVLELEIGALHSCQIKNIGTSKPLFLQHWRRIGIYFLKYLCSSLQWIHFLKTNIINPWCWISLTCSF